MGQQVQWTELWAELIPGKPGPVTYARSYPPTVPNVKTVHCKQISSFSHGSRICLSICIIRKMFK